MWMTRSMISSTVMNRINSFPLKIKIQNSKFEGTVRAVQYGT